MARVDTLGAFAAISRKAASGPGAEKFARQRLEALSCSLGDKPCLDGDNFTAGDLVMASVLRIARHTDLVTSNPRLGPYLLRCTARPAFKRAHEAQMRDFKPAG